VVVSGLRTGLSFGFSSVGLLILLKVKPPRRESAIARVKDGQLELVPDGGGDRKVGRRRLQPQ